ncbi:MAG TPA: sigma-70 family RNA polymerase sigma factor [Acetobacteraceae bacterium]|jgi:RNA polymerase sigma-70 factor (ECF subfamily)
MNAISEVRAAPSEAALAETKAELLASLPKLRAFAVSLCGRGDRADDLVQETLVRAWANLSSFEPGSNMAAWLYTILRNEFYSQFRKRRHEVPDTDGQFAARLASHPAQDGHMQFLDFRDALFRLAPDHREALVLIGASGLSYEEAAAVCGCAVGTMKSRVNRARTKLAELLTMKPDMRFGPDQEWDAAVDASWSATSAPLSEG